MASGFLLSMLSPVWRAVFCGGIGTNKGPVLVIMMEEVEESLFSKLIALACGKSVTVDRGLQELIELVQMADRYQMEAIQGDLEEAVIDRLTAESCGRILTMVFGSGLVRLERASRKLALREFDQFAESAGFMEVSEEVLGSLLDNDGLVSESEDRAVCAE